MSKHRPRTYSRRADRALLRDDSTSPKSPSILGTAALVSVLLHLAIAVAIYNRPIGYLDPSASPEFRQRMQTVRLVADDVAPLPPPRTTDATDESEIDISQELADLGRTLLDRPTMEMMVDALDAPDPVTELPAARRDPIESPHQRSAEPPVAGIPSDVVEQMVGDLELSVDIGAGGAVGVGDSGASGVAGSGTTGVGDEALMGQVHSLLQSATIDSVPGGVPMPRLDVAALPPSPERPPVDIGPILDHTPLRVDLGESAIRVGQVLRIPESLDQDFDVQVRTHSRGADNNFFEVRITPRETLARLRVMPKDIVYLVDLSGSIPQPWVNQTMRGISNALAALNAEDRFNIVFFAAESAFFSADGIVSATDENILRAQRFLEDRKSDGFTDINLALSRLLIPDPKVDRAYNLIFFSDGVPTVGVQDTRDLINLITRDNRGLASIYTVGIAEPRHQNRTVLEFLAYRNRGLAIHSDSPRNVAQDIRELASRIRYPVMKDVRVTVAGAGAAETFPIRLPNIHQGESFHVYGRFEEAGEVTMRISGHNGQDAYDFTFTKDLAQAEEGSRLMPQEWAKMKVHHLYSEMLRANPEEEAQLIREIRELRRRYRIEIMY